MASCILIVLDPQVLKRSYFLRGR